MQMARALISKFCFFMFVCTSLALAQEQPQSSQPPSGQEPVVSVKVKLVAALATVRDKHGQFVRNLSKDDFVLEEDSRPQTIRYFSQETDVPLTLGLLVDTSLSQRRLIEKERTASRSFLGQVLREDKDQAFLIHFDREVELLQDLTPSRQKLEAALDQMQTPHFEDTRGNDPNGGGSPGGRGGGGRGHGRGSGGGTLLYDAVFLASDELMKKQQGRKAVIILSDGVDHGSKESLEAAIESAQRSDTVVYSILFKDDEPFNGGGGWGGHIGGGGMGRHGGGRPFPQESRPDGKKILERISRETGGRLFEVSKKETLEQIYGSIQEELRNQYSLAYTPDAQSSGTGYHKIKLTTKQKDLKIQTREGYYADR
jgi:VWFA-related protein